ncbi:MAG: hypothetical protein ACKVJA_04310 [Flavobacteriales bacterium]
MIKIVRNICVLIVAVLVIFLSVGAHISTMKCDKEFTFYLGKEVPNCKTEKKISCNIDMEKLSCCKKEEMQKSCCPTTNGCEKDTELLQFTFETVVAQKQNITDCKEIYLFKTIQNNLFKLSVHDYLITHFQAESPLLLTKPILPELQSFLL